MKILHLVRSLGVGGLENVVLTLINASRDPNVEYYLGCLIEEGEWISKARVHDTWVGNLADKGKWRTLLSLRRFVRKNRIDLIHSHNPQPHLLAAAAHLLTGIPVVHTKHGQNYPNNPRWVWLSRQLSRCTEKIVAVGEYVQRIATDVEKVPTSKVCVIRNGIRIADFGMRISEGKDKGVAITKSQELRTRNGIPEGAFVIGSVGRFATEKDYPFLVRAFAKFLRNSSKLKVESSGKKSVQNKSEQKDAKRSEEPRRPQPWLLLIGDGPERAQ